MLETLCNKRRIRDFLKLYSSDKWLEIISNLCEIAILNLKGSFHTLQFSNEDFISILDNLKHPPKRIRKPKQMNYNYQDCNYQMEKQPYTYIEQPYHPQKLYDERKYPYNMNDYDDDLIYTRNRSCLKGRFDRNGNNYYYYPPKTNKEIYSKSSNYKNVESRIKGEVERDKERYYNELKNKKEIEIEDENEHVEEIGNDGGDNYNTNNNNNNTNEYIYTFGMKKPNEAENEQMPELDNNINQNE